MVNNIGVLRGNRFSNVLRLAMGFRVSDGKMVFSEKNLAPDITIFSDTVWIYLFIRIRYSLYGIKNSLR